MISPNGIAHIQLTVNDPARCLPFWERLCHFLGMTTLVRNADTVYCIGGRTGVLVRGARAQTDVIRSDADTATVEARFDVAPHSAARTGWTRPALALAASLAGVAVVGWLALAPTQESAQIASTPVPVLASTAPAQAQTLRLQEYLVAHQAHGGAGQITGGVRNVRTVAVAMEAR